MSSLTRCGLITICALTLSATLLADEAGAQDCKPKVKAKLEADLKVNQAILDKAKPVYELNCASCHGDTGVGDGPAGKVLNPPPRNFATDKFTKGTSVLAVYNTLTNGLPGTNMAAFDTLPESERLALSHYVRTMIPESTREKTTPQQLEEACIEISNPKLPSIPVNLAMEILAEEAEAGRKKGRDNVGPVKTNKAGGASSGKVLFTAQCASCHGPEGRGLTEYARFGRAPFIFVSTFPLNRNVAHGTWQQFAERTALGVHATLPDLTEVATLSNQDWMDLQVFISGFDGSATVEDDTPAPPKPKPALIGAGDGYELVYIDDKVFKLTTKTEEQTAPFTRIATYDEFKQLYVKPADAPDLPEALGTDIISMSGIVGLDCIGQRKNVEDVKPGCGQLGDTPRTTITVKIASSTFKPAEGAPENP